VFPTACGGVFDVRPSPTSAKLSVSWQTSQAFRACPTGVFAVHRSVGRTHPAKPLRLRSVLKARCIRVLWQKAASTLCRKALAIGKIGLPSGVSTCQTPGCCGSAPPCAALLCRHPAGTQFVTKSVRFLRQFKVNLTLVGGGAGLACKGEEKVNYARGLLKTINLG
jgi:hypothetical protein